MAETSIEWADAVWNPSTGCDRVSPGCDLCYAMTLAKRLKAMGSAKYQRDGDPHTSGPGFGVTVHEDALTLPLRWKKPRRIFVNSMSDLFHDDIPDEYIAKVFAVMALARRHTFQLLTKRHGRMRSLLNNPSFRLGCEEAEGAILADASCPLPRYQREARHVQWWSDFAKPLPNVWLGVSVENQRWADIRIPALLDTPAAVRWLSCEPLLGPVDLTNVAPGLVYANAGFNAIARTPDRIDWVVVGGESGPGARPMDLDWADSLVQQCRAAGVPAFVKQLGSRWGKNHHDIDLFPEGLRVREYPVQASQREAVAAR